MRALWIEIYIVQNYFNCFRSRPVRALWIEINPFGAVKFILSVEAREGLVD